MVLQCVVCFLRVIVGHFHSHDIIVLLPSLILYSSILQERSANLTAPNYVLEESLSSQKLWKQSAGHRPPQPVEERAFYEKMWAQNFERSQVDYQMPVEVLTAASPISLNPFADGNFEHDGAATDYAVISPPQMPQSSGGDVAEGMLVRGMNDHDRLATTVVNKKVKTEEGDLTVLVRGDNVFGAYT